jgi:hypothetical protein
MVKYYRAGLLISFDLIDKPVGELDNISITSMFKLFC